MNRSELNIKRGTLKNKQKFPISGGKQFFLFIKTIRQTKNKPNKKQTQKHTSQNIEGLRVR